MAEENMISLFNFEKRPTKPCIQLVLLCVYVFVYNPHIVCPSLLDDNFTSYMDNATAYFAMCLCCLLALGGFGLLWCMSYNSLRETVIKSGGQVRLILFKVCSVLFAVGFYAFLTSGLFFATRTFQSFFARSSSLLWMCDSRGAGTRHGIHYRHFLKWNSDHPYEDTLERYLSEDVQFICEFDIPDIQVLDVGSNITYTLWWTRDSERNPIRSSSRFIFDEQTGADIKYTVTRDGSFHKIRAKLLILRLNESDFGMYQCHVQVWKHRKKEQARSAQVDGAGVVTIIDLGTFKLKPQNFGHQDFDAYPGQMLLIQVQPWMIKYNDDEIIFIHRVNSSKSEFNARVENRSDLCTYTHSSRHYLIERTREHEDNQELHIKSDPDLDDYTACVQFEDYSGVHSFVIRRHFYNEDTQGPDFIETEFPLTLSVRPPKQLWATFAINESFFTECWEGIFFTPSEHCLEWGYSMMETALKWYCLVTWGMAYVIPLVVIFPYMKLTKYLLSFLLQGSLCPPVINSLCGVPCTPAITKTGRIPLTCYDVFLAYEQTWPSTTAAADAVREVLENQSLRVFDCQRDVSPNEPLLTAWDRAIDDSASFVVLVSRQYLADPVLQAQFRSMHYRVLSHEVSEDKMLIIPLGHVPISRDLGPLQVINPRHVTSYRQLEWWALSVAARHGRGNIAIMLAQNAGRDARYLLIKRRRILQQPLEVSDTACMEGERAVCLPLGGRSYSDHDDKVAKKDVFLTYCEDSDSDCALAAKVLSHLQGLGLSVLDVVHDILGGREETAVVAAAAQCASFVVLLSPAYRSHPLTRRLHFPQVLQAVETGRVSVDHVLIIRTGYGKNSAIVTKQTIFNPHVYAATGTVSITSGLMNNGDNVRSPCGSTQGEIYRVTDQVAAAARAMHPEITRDRCVESLPGSDGNKTTDTNRTSSKIATTPKARFRAEDEDTDHTGCLHRSATQACSGSSEVTSVDADITATRSLAIQPWSRACQDDYRCTQYFQPDAWTTQDEDDLHRFCDEEDLGEENYSLPDGLQGLNVISWTGGLAEEDYLRYVTRWAKPVLTYVNDRARAAAGKDRLNVKSRFPSIRE